MTRFSSGLPLLGYLIQRFLWQRQKHRKTERRQRESETWRLVRTLAAHSRQRRQTTPTVRRIDLPDRPPDRPHNGNYRESHHNTFVPHTKVIFPTAHYRPTITPGRRRSGDAG